MQTGRWIRTLSLALGGALAACGGGGPGVQGPEALELFERYTGTWLLDEASSEDIPMPTQGAARGEGRGGEGFTGGIGGASGRGGSGGRGGGGPPTGFNPEAMQATMSRARARPNRIALELTDSTFAAT